MHVHTLNSPDARLSEDELAERALEEGLAGLGFVAHLDFEPEDPCCGFFDGERYRGAVLSAAEKHPETVILLGLEVGEPHLYHDQVEQTIDREDYDFVTGALHWVGDLSPLFPEAFRREPAMKLIELYYRATLDMVRKGSFHILAHMGLFRRGMALAGLDPSLDETRLWPGLIEEILGTMIERKIVLELNTSGLRRRERMTYPDRPVLEMYRALGGRLVTLGSDTHDDPWVFYGLEEGRRRLIGAGFEDCCYLKGGEGLVHPLQP